MCYTGKGNRPSSTKGDRRCTREQVLHILESKLYRGYFLALKTRTYIEMRAEKVNDSHIDMIFVPINQGDHLHLLTV